MLILCPNCATSYRVEPSSLGAAGRSVRCVRCRKFWFAHDPTALAAIAQAYRAEIDDLIGATTGNDAAAPRPEAPATPADDPRPPAAADTAAIAHSFDAEPAPAETPADALTAEATVSAWADQGPTIAIANAPALAPMQAPALAPTEHDLSLPGDAKLGEDIETIAARRAPRVRHRSRWSLPGLPLAILALIALNAALIGWRAHVVKVAPQTGSLYASIRLPVNLRGLTFADVASSTEMEDGVQVLVVEGTIASASSRVVEVPRLRFSVRNPGGQEVYAWTALPSRSLLAPGETLAFRSRLASPPPDARDVLVRFFNRRDLVAGVQ
jgi:predicted Zn finger-like uncharacterized protein